MTSPGAIQEFFIVELNDLMYKSHNRWTSKDHDVTRMDLETATRVARRYHGATVEKGYGYDFALRRFEDLEPDANQAIREAVRLAKADGQSLERVLVTTEVSYNAETN